jgi:hypothetical protein
MGCTVTDISILFVADVLIPGEQAKCQQEALSNQQSAVSLKQDLFTAEDAEPRQQAKTGLAGSPGGAKEKKPEKGLPRR